MIKRILVLSGIMVLGMSACTPSVKNAGGVNSATQNSVTSENSVEQTKPVNAVQEMPIEAGMADLIDEIIDDRFGMLAGIGQGGGGIAVGILIDGKIAYTHCAGMMGTKPDARVTPKSKFNVHPVNPFKLSSETKLFTAEGFKNAGVDDISFSPDESFAHPYDISLNTPESESEYHVTELPFAVTQADGSLWASLEDTLRYLVLNPTPDGMENNTYDHFDAKTLRTMLHGSGYTVSLVYVPSHKVYIVLLENSVDLGIDFYEDIILGILLPEYRNSNNYVDEEFNPHERRIFYELDRERESSLIAKYKCNEEYRDFEIVWEDNEFILKTEHWSSRIGGSDTYDIEMNKTRVTDDGELIIDGAIEAYRLLDAPVSDMEIAPEFDENKNILSVTVGEEIQVYETIENSRYHSRVIDVFMTCKPVR